MPTLVNNLRAIRGPVTAVPMVGQSGVVVEPDTQNNQVVIRADETVLWSGNSLADSAIQLNEAANNFEYIEIHAFWSGRGSTMSVREDIRSRFTPDTLNHSLSTIVPLGNSGYDQIYVACNVIKLANDYMSISSVLRFRSALNGANRDTNDATRITKIVGINRIANN